MRVHSTIARCVWRVACGVCRGVEDSSSVLFATTSGRFSVSSSAYGRCCCWQEKKATTLNLFGKTHALDALRDSSVADNEPDALPDGVDPNDPTATTSGGWDVYVCIPQHTPPHLACTLP